MDLKNGYLCEAASSTGPGWKRGPLSDTLRMPGRNTGGSDGLVSFFYVPLEFTLHALQRVVYGLHVSM